MQNMLLLWIKITLKGWRTILSLFRQQFFGRKVSNVTENLIPRIFYEIMKMGTISPPPHKKFGFFIFYFYHMLKIKITFLILNLMKQTISEGFILFFLYGEIVPYLVKLYRVTKLMIGLGLWSGTLCQIAGLVSSLAGRVRGDNSSEK